MRPLVISACAVLIFMANLPAQDAPTSAPGSETASNGQITYTPPADWTLIGKSKDDRHIGYKLGENRGQIVIAIAPQAQAVSETERKKLADLLTANLTNAIKNEATKGNIEIVSE